MKVSIPVAEPTIGKEEERLVLDTLRSGWVSSIGKYIDEFEKEFARFCGVKYAISTTNGTAALHLALVAAGIGPGDEVIVPSLTFVATANTVSYTGAKPVFVDSELETWNIDPEKIKEKINRRTRAIIPVHLYGHPTNMSPILTIARKYNLLVIEDAAESHGALYKGKMTGSLGNAGCFSFFGNKIITTGEGGMITTNNKAFVETVRIFRDHGSSRKRRYYHPKLGFNYRMTNLQAALGLAQLKKAKKIIDKKREIAKLYEKYLSPLVPEIILQPEAKWAKSVFWMYSILIPKNGRKNRDWLSRELKKGGIDSRPFFFPIHRLPRYKQSLSSNKTGEHLPNADFLASSGINLPSSVNLDKEKIKLICDTITDVLKDK